YPPVPGALALDWTGSRTLPRVGWEWAVLGLNPNIVRKHVPASRPTVLVSMGGSDPHGLTLRMAMALAPLDSVYRVRFVIGAGMGISLGVADKVGDAEILRSVERLLNNSAARRDMRKQGLSLLDGQGAARIAADLAAALAAARKPVKTA